MAFAQWFGAWLLFILLLAVLAKTAAGKTMAYYLLWLAVAYLLLSHSQEIAAMLGAANIAPQGSSNGG